jgi:hypothetical protein
MSSRKAKRQGTIDPPRAGVTVVRKAITVGKKTMIVTEYHGELSTTIYIGGESIYCIDMFLPKNRDGVHAETGVLTKVRWDAECSIAHDFTKGDDTIMILQLAMTYVKNAYPEVKFIEFNDLSTKQCDSGSSVSLSAMKLFTDGKTWYEDRFHAIISPRYAAIYEEMKSYADTIKKSMPWSEFIKYTAFNDMLPIDKIQAQYESSHTWQEFFKGIQTHLHKNKFCEWLSYKNWFDGFVQSKLRFNIMAVQFLIDVSKFNVEYTESKQGGKRKGIRRYTFSKKSRR